MSTEIQYRIEILPSSNGGSTSLAYANDFESGAIAAYSLNIDVREDIVHHNQHSNHQSPIYETSSSDHEDEWEMLSVISEEPRDQDDVRYEEDSDHQSPAEEASSPDDEAEIIQEFYEEPTEVVMIDSERFEIYKTVSLDPEM